MATAYQLSTFADIYTAVMEELKYQSSDTVSKNRIKRDINMVYLDEVVPFEQWKWLNGYLPLSAEPRYATGTATVTQGSTLVTLTNAPSTSRKGQWFSADGYEEVYKIAQHAAGSTSVYIEVPYTGSTAAGISFKIWTDKLPLPVDCRETINIQQDHLNVPMEGVGLKKFREYTASMPKAEGRPRFYTTGDFVDPDPYATIAGLPAVSTTASSGLVKTVVFASTVAALFTPGQRIAASGSTSYTLNGEFVVSTVSGSTITFTGKSQEERAAAADASYLIETLSVETENERYRELWIYPSIFTTRSTLHVDYVREASPLVEDADEPLMPRGDRMVLVYGALARAWSRERNPEEAQRNQIMFDRKLAKMAGKLDDSTDLPVLRTGKTYLAAKRSNYRNRSAGFSVVGGFSGGSGGAATPTGLPNTVAVFDNLGELTGSTTVSTTELGFLNGVTAPLVQTTVAQTLTNKSIDADLNTIINIENADIKAAAAIDVTKLQALTADRVAITSGSGFLSTSTVTPTELTYLANSVPLTTVALADNQASAANVFTFVATFEASIIEYNIARGAGNRETGTLMVATDGSTVNMTQVTSQLGTIGVTLTADISGGSVRVRYTSTSTGTAPTFKYIQRRWA